MSSRAIPISIHGALEMIAAPAIMAAPFLLGFELAATLVTVSIGVLLLGMSLELEAPRRSVPLTAHAAFDYTIATAAVVCGLAVGLAGGEWYATAFLAGVGAAMFTLTASTRFSVVRSA